MAANFLWGNSEEKQNFIGKFGTSFAFEMNLMGWVFGTSNGFKKAWLANSVCGHPTLRRRMSLKLATTRNHLSLVPRSCMLRAFGKDCCEEETIERGTRWWIGIMELIDARQGKWIPRSDDFMVWFNSWIPREREWHIWNFRTGRKTWNSFVLGARKMT